MVLGLLFGILEVNLLFEMKRRLLMSANAVISSLKYRATWNMILLAALHLSMTSAMTKVPSQCQMKALTLSFSSLSSQRFSQRSKLKIPSGSKENTHRTGGLY